MVQHMTELQIAIKNEKLLNDQLIKSGDLELEQYHKEKQSLLDDEVAIESLLDEINSPLDINSDLKTSTSLLFLNYKRKELEKKLSEISGTLTLKYQTDTLRDITEKSKHITINSIRNDLKDQSNRILLKVLSGDPLQIYTIDRSLSIANQSKASVGQTLAVGYVFLLCLLSRGNNQFPLVVDSPCGSLETGRRSEIGKLIPSLCNQFISFIIDTERPAFVNSIEESCSHDQIKYITMFRNTEGYSYLANTLPNTGIKISDSSILV